MRWFVNVELRIFCVYLRGITAFPETIFLKVSIYLVFVFVSVLVSVDEHAYVSMCVAVFFYLSAFATMCFVKTVFTAVSKKVVIVNNRYWNRKEMWGSSSTNNLLLLALTLRNIECGLIIMPRPHNNNLRWRVITRYDCVPKIPFGCIFDC